MLLLLQVMSSFCHAFLGRDQERLGVGAKPSKLSVQFVDGSGKVRNLVQKFINPSKEHTTELGERKGGYPHHFEVLV